VLLQFPYLLVKYLIAGFILRRGGATQRSQPTYGSYENGSYGYGSFLYVYLLSLHKGNSLYYIYLYFGPRTFLPRNFLEVLGISPLAFNEAVAVNPMDSPFL